MSFVAQLDLGALLERCVSEEASDLHLTTGQSPRVRVHGELKLLDELPALSREQILALSESILSEAQLRTYREQGALDLAWSLPSGQRFRFNLYSERGRTALAIRRLEESVRSLADLRLPPALAELVTLESGLVVVSGPTGSGKSTTLASLVGAINREHARHIITLEDPIEYLHESQRSLVHQRELHADFPDFPSALRSALREDPDVILVGEMRDTATMRAALQAAETGHLVFSTLHSGSAIGATERLIGAFPGPERDSIRHQLSLVLTAVVAQTLLPGRGGGFRVPVVELLWVTPAVANLIRVGKTAQLHSTMESQSAAGMRTQEQALAEGIERGWIDEEVARRAAKAPSLLDERLRYLRGKQPLGRGLGLGERRGGAR